MKTPRHIGAGRLAAGVPGLLAARLGFLHRGGEAEQARRCPASACRAPSARSAPPTGPPFSAASMRRVVARSSAGQAHSPSVNSSKLAVADRHVHGRARRKGIAAGEGDLARSPGAGTEGHEQQDVAAPDRRRAGRRGCSRFPSGCETPQHSFGFSSVKTLQSVLVATRFVDSCASAPVGAIATAEAITAPHRPA